MIDELRGELVQLFIAQARDHVAASSEHLDASALGALFHRLSGEADLLGLTDVARAAREISRLSRRASEDGTALDSGEWTRRLHAFGELLIACREAPAAGSPPAP